MPNVILDENIISESYLFETVTEAVKKSIPDVVHKSLSKIETRQKMLDKLGSEAFIDPTNLKYPIYNPISYKIDCRLISAAIARSKQHHQKDIEKKAIELAKKHNCTEKININIGETVIDINDLSLFFNIEESTIPENKSEYDKIVKDTMKKYNINKFSDLKDKAEKSKFFDELDSKWVTKREQLNRN